MAREHVDFHPDHETVFLLSFRPRMHVNHKNVCRRLTLEYGGYLAGDNVLSTSDTISEELGWMATSCEDIEHWIYVDKTIPTLPIREEFIASFPEDTQTAITEACGISPTEEDPLTAQSLTDQLFSIERQHYRFPDWSGYTMLFSLTTGFSLFIHFEKDENSDRLKIKHCKVSPPARY